MNMKKYLLLSAVACTLAGCSNDFNPADVVVDKGSNTETKEAPIGFSATNKNMLREAPGLEQSHYNFGVFAYKNGGNGTESTIMKDYLVGYMDGTQKKGYKFGEGQTTLQSGVGSPNDNVSFWAYEKLGTAEYTLSTNNGEEKYYTTGQTFYMSNNANQYLRYWDHSSTSTNFYAYAPYYNHGGNTGVTFDNTTKKLNIPDGAIKAGIDDATQFEAMYAAANVEEANYDKDVQLEFKRLVSKIKIGFYEDIEGYGVTIKPLKTGEGFDIVSAAPATRTAGDTYSRADIRKQAGATITFNGANNVENATVDYTGGTYYDNDTKEYISFKIPTGAVTAGETNDAPQGHISTTKPLVNTDYSETTYYGIPKDNNAGLTFHVTFKLHSTTGETITVHNATVFVGGNDCKWEANKQYTYIFKITKKATGTTGTPGDIDPGDPNVNDQALYPIVFDGCTVEDWEAPSVDTDHNIND